jgi:hypothetical protein
MKILVRHPEGDSSGRLALHAEKLLRRLLGDSCLSIDLIEVKLKTAAGAEGKPEYRCALTVKPLSDDAVQAEASDCADILAVYRAADKVKILLNKRLKSSKKVQGAG